MSSKEQHNRGPHCAVHPVCKQLEGSHQVVMPRVQARDHIVCWIPQAHQTVPHVTRVMDALGQGLCRRTWWRVANAPHKKREVGGRVAVCLRKGTDSTQTVTQCVYPGTPDSTDSFVIAVNYLPGLRHQLLRGPVVNAEGTANDHCAASVHRLYQQPPLLHWLASA